MSLWAAGDLLNSTNLNTKRPSWSTTTPYYDIDQYGAVGDGVTDDTTAFNAVRTAAQATNGMIRLTPGATYLISNTIAFTAPVHVWAYGATVKLANASKVAMFTTTSKLRWFGGTIEGNGSNQTGGTFNSFGFRILNNPATDCIIADSTIQNTTASAIYNQGTRFHARDLYILNCGDTTKVTNPNFAAGILGDTVTDAWYTNVRISTPGANGIYHRSTARNTGVFIIACSVTQPSLPSGTYLGIAGGQIDGYTVQGCYVENFRDNCYDTNGCTRTHLLGNMAVNGAQDGFFFGDNTASGAVIANNVSDGCPTGIRVNSTGTSVVEEVSVANNTVIGATINAIQFGTNAAGATLQNVAIHGNVLSSSSAAIKADTTGTNTNIIFALNHVIAGSIDATGQDRLVAGNAAAATTLGSVTGKIQVFDSKVSSLGYLPLYGSIT